MTTSTDDVNRTFTAATAQWELVQPTSRQPSIVRDAGADIAPLSPPPRPGDDEGWALFLDVDGTLLDFARNPDDVRVDPHLHADLERLYTRLDGALALLSGRPLAQLDELFDWHGKAAAGLHGAELRNPEGRERVTGDAAAFAQVRARAAELAVAQPELMLEDKRLALALHYRYAPEARGAAEDIARALLELAGNRYALQHGDHVIELKPAGADKGRAFDLLMAEPPFRERTPWMLGDDLTDEDAFRRVNLLDGVSVVIGNRRPTEANYALDDPAAVRAWLHALATAPSP